jgi:DNA-binding PadR family transcriptional regulator
MNHSNLSWSFAHTFIRTLEKQGLISTILMKGKKNFILTERGKRALAAYTAVTTELDFGSNRADSKEEAKEPDLSEETLLEPGSRTN